MGGWLFCKSGQILHVCVGELPGAGLYGMVVWDGGLGMLSFFIKFLSHAIKSQSIYFGSLEKSTWEAQ